MTSADNVDRNLDRHYRSVDSPQRRISDILAGVEEQRDRLAGQEAADDLVKRLREANEHLVIATFGAQDLQAAAEAASRSKEEFLSMLAHELRNPLAPVAMATSMLGTILSAHPLLPKLHGILARQVSHLVRLVDDLLDASRVNRGKISLNLQALVLADMLDAAVETSQPFIDARHQHLLIDVPSAPLMIDGDAVRLAQLFSNLLINAAKFTPENGNLCLRAELIDQQVSITVQDDGVGIAPELLPLVFDLFTQGPRALDRAQGGLGIGLTLVRTIAQMHGGSAEAKSAGLGRGSEFIVTLPLSGAAAPLSPSAGAAIAQALIPCRVLLVEDHVDANQLLSDVLSLEGFAVTASFDGPSGLQMAREHTYDVIICDIGLPGMSGYELLTRLRQHLPKPWPYFIALTGYDDATHRLQAANAGFDHFLVKPIDIGILVRLISSRTLQ